MNHFTFSQLKEIKAFCEDLRSQPDWREVVEKMSEGVIDFDVNGVRFIDEDEIEEIWTASLIELIKDCYDLSNIPSFVEIDWEQSAENCKADGKGHHFNSYDGGEEHLLGYDVFDNG